MGETAGIHRQELYLPIVVNAIGFFLTEQDKLSEAEAVYQRALERRERIRGRDHSLVEPEQQPGLPAASAGQARPRRALRVSRSQEWPTVGAAVQEDARAGSSLEMHLLKIGND